MSWKTAPPDAPASAPAATRPWSLAMRLAVGFGVASFALLLAVSGYLYWALSGSLVRDDINYLAEEVEEVEMLLASKPDGVAALRDHLRRETAAHAMSSPLYIRAFDSGGNPVAASADMDQMIPPARFPSPGPVGHPAHRRETLDDGRPFHVMAATARIDGALTVIQIALDRTFEHRLLDRYRERLLVALLIGLIVCAVTGYAIARRGLRPLGHMAAAIERVRSSTLHQRVNGAAFPAELSSLAATFNAMLTRLEDAFARLTRFSADIAHELRTPIHNIRGMVEVTLAKANKQRSDEERRRLLEPCLEECHRLSRLIDNLLFVARAENPETQIARQPVDVADELAKVQDFYEAAAAEAGVTLEIDAPVNGAQDTRVTLDRQLFQQAMCNLVENALAHTPSGGRVRLCALRENGAVRVEVADTGAGIPQEHLPFVFDRFHRVDASRSKHTGGVGLGLALVKSIVTLHGGTASVASTVGAGSTFTITFPDVRK